MIHISSGTTLAWRIFIPVFFLVFVGLFILTLAFGDMPFVMGIPTKFFRIFIFLFYFLTLAVMYRTVWQLKRVDVDEEYIYVSDYFKHFRYPIDDLASVSAGSSIFRPAVMYLKESGTFGQEIKFLPSRKRWKQFLERFPQFQ